MRSVAIFCGSNTGVEPIFAEKAKEVGQFLAQKKLTLIYGGGSVGLMGVVADAALQAGGQVVGVIPKALLDGELGHQNLTQLHVVTNMHERKQKMADLADAFIALPGGPGTLEELFEQWTWGQLGYHQKPCAFLNVANYYQPLAEFVQQMKCSGFLKPAHAEMVIFSNDIHKIWQAFETYQVPQPKW
ncbi:TIGR00730 family Rossman fold protein [Pseudomonas sp. F1_0610]|uniref:LOG family protein n=1 Tax=Pseudomonas sp. F1_0610 TaxID=3114284 RepID=UPI0039C2CC02